MKYDHKGQAQSPLQDNRDLELGILHLWLVFGVHSLKVW